MISRMSPRLYASFEREREAAPLMLICSPDSELNPSFCAPSALRIRSSFRV
jgi:hypothetical protein